MSQNNSDFLTSILLGFFPLSLILGVLISSTSILLIDLIFLLYCIKNKFWSWVNYPYFKIILFLYIYLLFNNFIALDNTLSSARNIGFVRYLIFIPAIIFFFKNTRYQNIIFFCWSFFIILTVLDAYYEFFNGVNFLGFKTPNDTFSLHFPYNNRLVSFFKNEEIVGSFINGFLLIITGFLFYLNKKKTNNFYKYFFLLTIMLIATTILISGERSAAIKAMLGLLIFFYLCKEFKFLYKIYATLFILTTIIFVISSNDYLKTRYYGQILKNFNDTTILYFYHYRSGYEVFKKYPVFGVGNKNYGKTCFNELDTPHENDFERGVCSTHPHQIYFEFLSEHGLIGTLFMLLSFSIIIFKNFKNYIKYNNKIHLGAMIFVTLTFLPLIPSGSFFGNYSSTIFWINFSIMLAFESKKINIKLNEKL